VRTSLSIDDIDGDGTKDKLVRAGILWMQGESDGMYGEEIANDYEKNLKRLMDLFRAALRADDLPVAIGRISDSKRDTAEKIWKFGDQVREAQASFCLHDREARLVTESDLYKYSDPYHYDSKGYLELGKRFAEAIMVTPTSPIGDMFEDGAKLKVEIAGGAGGEGPVWNAELGVLSSGNDHINR